MINLTILLIIIFYSIIQSITEWLPISSTAHLIIVSKFLPNVLDKNFFSLFMVVIQLASILAMVTVYKDKLFFKNNVEFKEKKNLYLKIVLSSIPCVIVGLLMNNIIEKFQDNILIIVISLLVIGIVFLFIDKIIKVKKDRNISYKDSFIIGLFQIFAMVFPGVSRSGITLIGGLLLGYKKEESTSFSFMMSIPVMCGATVLQIIKYHSVLNEDNIILLFIGCIFSYFMSLGVIKWLLRYLKNHSYFILGIYRIILGVIVYLVTFIF